MKPDSGHLDLERLDLTDAPELRHALDAAQGQIPDAQQLAALAARLSQMGLPVLPPAQVAANATPSATRLKLLLGAGVIGPLTLALLLWRSEPPRGAVPAALERTATPVAHALSPSAEAAHEIAAASRAASGLPASAVPRPPDPSAAALGSSTASVTAEGERAPSLPAMSAQVRAGSATKVALTASAGVRSASAPDHASVANSNPGGVVARPTEVALLRDAQLALRSNPAEALALAEQHRALFGRGAMVQERELIAITALARLGRHTAVLARAAQFERDFPTSPYRKQVSALGQ